MSFLTLAELRTDTPAAREMLRTLLPQAHGDAGHRLIWSLFGGAPDAQRDFLYRATSDRTFMVISARAPSANDAVWNLRSKPYDPSLTEGQRLGFSLRVNPSISLSQPDRRPSRRVDIFQYHQRAHPGPLDMEEREQLAADWLAQKLAAHGAELDRGCVQLSGLSSLRLTPKRATLTTIDMDGALTVTDPDALHAALHQGIGHGKAYGLGLLLLRPV